jgi:uncharacterized protein (TIGR02231 family)
MSGKADCIAIDPSGVTRWCQGTNVGGMPTAMEAPIVAVTVYPQHARITRRGRAALAGESKFTVEGLPLGVSADSVRANGSGPASIAGVDVGVQRRAEYFDGGLRELRERRRAAQGRLDEVVDAEAVETSKAELLNTLTRRSGAAFAKALAAGSTEPERVAGVGDALAGQLAQVLGRRRELATRHTELADEVKAIDRAIGARSSDVPDSTVITIELETLPDAPADAEIELEVSYVVTEAWWQSGYDVRLTGETVTVTWHGVITQHTGEDWPECELALSTARPAATVGVPELQPWFLDRVSPMQPVHAFAAAGGYGSAGPGGAPEGGCRAQSASLKRMAPMADMSAVVEQGAAAATYRPARPIAVPSDGSAHRSTIARLELEAKLDYVTAPVIAEEAFLRAVVVNGSEHTLRPGNASVFHETEYVGTTRLDLWAPGEEVELALGVDERVRVERELVRRTAGKATLSGTKRREAEYRTKITNHGPRDATVTVLDQVPVSRDDGIVIKEVRAKPEPAETTELGELTWRLDLAPGKTGEITLGFRVDAAKGVSLAGWRE